MRDFYILAGTASATLVGLLFVGLSLHLRIVISVAEIRGLARVTLANFGAVLFVTMFMVIDEDRITTAIQLIVSGLISLLVATPSFLSAVRSGGRTLEMRARDRLRLLLRFGLSIVSYVAVIISGLLLLSGLTSAFNTVLVSAIVVLLVMSLRNTWDLLVTVGDVTVGPDQ